MTILFVRNVLFIFLTLSTIDSTLAEELSYNSAKDTLPAIENELSDSSKTGTPVYLPEVTIEDQQIERRKREETLGVDVLDTDFMQKHQRGSLMQTLRRIPGIQAVNVGSGQSKPLIRGLGFNRIVVSEHGIKHEGQQWGADHALEIDQFAHDYIELIKGPSALMYGSDAIGGVIQLNNRKIPDSNTLTADVNFIGRSNNQLLGNSAALKGRTQNWYFTSRITLLDYADSKVPTDSVDVYSFRVPLNDRLLRNTAGNELNLHLSAGFIDKGINSRFFISHVRQRAGFFANAHGLEPRRVDTDLYDQSSRDILYPRQDARHFKVVNRTIMDWGKYLFIAENGYQNNFREEFSQYVNHGYRPPVFPDTLGIPAELERSFHKHTLSSNIRIINQWKDNHKITTGLSAEYQNNDIDGISFMIPAFELFTAGGYLLHEWKVNNNLQVSGGLRYDRAILKTESYYDWFPTQGIFLQRAEKLDKSFGSFSGMLGANYHSGKSIFRINLGRSFRIPLAKELAANGINYHRFSYEVGDPSLQPEIAWQLDMGAEYATPLWQARISPFISYFPNYLYLNPGFEFDFSSGAGNQVFYYTGSEVFRWGGEFTFMIEPVKNLIIDFSAEYVYSEQLDGAKKGFTIPFSPPASLLTEFGWNPWGEQKFSKLRFLSFSLETRFTMPQNRIVPPEKKTDGYNVFSAGVGGKGFLYGNKFDWRFRVNNLFDTHYLEHTSHYRLIGVPEPGRNFTFSVNIPFEIIQSKENNT